MTHRERQVAALGRKPTDRISIDAVEFKNIERLQASWGAGVNPHDYLGLDGRIIGPTYTGELSGNLDQWGTAAFLDYSTTNAYPLSHGLKGFAPPDPDLYNYDEMAALAAEWSKEYAIRGPYWHTLFSRTCSLYGMEEAMVKMYSDPKEFEQVTEMVFEHM